MRKKSAKANGKKCAQRAVEEVWEHGAGQPSAIFSHDLPHRRGVLRSVAYVRGLRPQNATLGCAKSRGPLLHPRALYGDRRYGGRLLAGARQDLASELLRNKSADCVHFRRNSILDGLCRYG